MRFRNKHNSSEENFWLSATDMMAGILIVVLLLLLLFLLYLNSSVDEEFTPLDATSNTEVIDTRGNEGGYTSPPVPTEPTHSQNEGEGGGGTEAAATEAPTEEDERGDDKGEKRAAVYVTVVDADSGNVIKKSGIAFELYSYKNGVGGLQTLSTYYQEKTEYRKFETGDAGSFYLPEKLRIGYYSLHNLSAPEGYIVDENTGFDIDENCDWTEPFVVTVKMKPIKKTIRITAEDADTEEGLPNIEFEIIAAKESSSSQVKHFAEGDVVDRVKTNNKGYAETRELYVGSYFIRQTTAPKYYVIDQKSIAASISEATDVETGMIKVDCYKSSVTLTLTDERTEDPIKGAVYTMKGRKDLVTDENGQITIEDLEKATNYMLSLKSLPDGYISKEKDVTFKVDKYGMIDDKVSESFEETAYTITLSVEAKDLLFGRKAKGVDLELLEEDGTVVHSWTTNDSTYTASGLHEGKFYVQRAGDPSSRVTVYLSDTSELKTADIRVWDTIDWYAVLMAGGAVVILGLVLGVFINRRKKVSRKHESQR